MLAVQSYINASKITYRDTCTSYFVLSKHKILKYVCNHYNYYLHHYNNKHITTKIHLQVIM